MPAQTKPGTLGSALKALVEAAGRLVDALAPQPAVQPVPVRVSSGRRR